MTSVTTKPEFSQPAIKPSCGLFDDWFDPIELGIRRRVLKRQDLGAHDRPGPCPPRQHRHLDRRRLGAW